MNDDKKAIELAANIRNLLKNIDEKVVELQKLGYNDARIVRDETNDKHLKLLATKTSVVKL